MLLHVCTRRPSKTGQWVRWAILATAAAHVRGDTAPRYIMQAACFGLASHSQTGSIPPPAAPHPHSKHIPHQLLHRTLEPAKLCSSLPDTPAPIRLEGNGTEQPCPPIPARCQAPWGWQGAGWRGRDALHKMLCSLLSPRPDAISCTEVARAKDKQ